MGIEALQLFDSLAQSSSAFQLFSSSDRIFLCKSIKEQTKQG